MKFIQGGVYTVVVNNKIMFQGEKYDAYNYAKGLSMHYKKIEAKVMNDKREMCQAYQRGRCVMGEKNRRSIHDVKAPQMSAYALARKMCLPMYSSR